MAKTKYRIRREVLIAARKQRGLTQKDLHKATGISLPRIQVLEAGPGITLEYAEALSKELNIPIHQLCEVI